MLPGVRQERVRCLCLRRGRCPPEGKVRWWRPPRAQQLPLSLVHETVEKAGWRRGRPRASILGLNHKLWIQWRGHSGSHRELRCNGKLGGCKAEELALSAVELGIFVGLRHDLERNKQEVAREKMVEGLGLCQTLGPTPCGERGGGPCFQQSGLLRSED